MRCKCSREVTETPLVSPDFSLSVFVHCLWWAAACRVWGDKWNPQSPKGGRWQLEKQKAWLFCGTGVGEDQMLKSPGLCWHKQDDVLSANRAQCCGRVETMPLWQKVCCAGAPSLLIIWEELIQRVHSNRLTQRCSGAASSAWCHMQILGRSVLPCWQEPAWRHALGTIQLLPPPEHGHVHALEHAATWRSWGICWILWLPISHHLQRCSILLVCDASRGQAVSSHGLGSWWVQITAFHLGSSRSEHELSYSGFGKVAGEGPFLRQLGALEDPHPFWRKNWASAQFFATEAKFFWSSENGNTLAQCWQGWPLNAS